MQNNLLSLDMYTGVTPSVAEMHKPGIQAGSRALEKVLQQMLQRVTRVTRPICNTFSSQCVASVLRRGTGGRHEWTA